ncbi:MAG: AmmeMemoRadiSam system protein B [Candidatus Eremiobacteraeota bacterium]|nr:AmmeMemoRadiSam system protein B [Candidatus Eremiobacteraeota bacterium]
MRKPFSAGMFYPANPKELRALIDEYLEKAKPPEVEEPIIALVSPHAGYPFSGQLAAYDFKLLKGKPVKTVFILGINHRFYHDGMAVLASGAYQTPLGLAEIDEEAAKKLIASSPRLKNMPEIHNLPEHSLEVMVPFIQVVLPGAKIVPVVFSRPNLEDCTIAAKALAKIFEPGRSVIIASSDMSHDHPYEEAVSMDKRVLDLMEKMDVEGLVEVLRTGKGELCGEGPVLTSMLLAKTLGAHGTILGYTNSGEVMGDRRSRIVGYGAVAFSGIKFQKPGESKQTNESRAGISNNIPVSSKKEMLKIARQTLNSYIRENKIPKIEFKSPILKEKRGLFITLHKGKQKDLRGCIGYIEGLKPLGEAIQDMAVNSSTRDPRFPPVRPEELDDITIEVSLLSPLMKIENPDEIIPGKHGVVVKKGWHQGLFLPQVWEQLPDKETFMSHLCAGKAGLSPDAWKDKDTELYIFTVEHFEEEH